MTTKQPKQPKQPPSDLPIHAFPTAQALEDFLEREHTTARGFYLQLAKKASNIPSVSASDAVESALCFGWIDGRAHALDQSSWLVRYTPRRAKSLWSQKNVATAVRLELAGRMRPAGRAAVEAAQADGRWSRAYAGPATMTVPEDFERALESASRAKTVFDGLTRTERYTVLFRVQTASPRTRAGTIEAAVQKLAGMGAPRGSTGRSTGMRRETRKRKRGEDEDRALGADSGAIGETGARHTDNHGIQPT
ncbi:hypothetical protein N7462_007421 [Penicillium macrosclerotiorum]|uniref:uncharacterized protein n=1 Tax=Penicillium macrosclerotiorum TaxID=303699 RepID=UPI002549B513|nr:uncharacterized protein N7462_007421 [Penicillium macrosclerotiorum]KAJ5679177.1 hypothetical protein N7462_007421 [Penicillium macrosclerotiorum]